MVSIPCLCITYSDAVTVLLADPSHRDAKMELASIYEILNEPKKALDLVMQGKTNLTLQSKLCVAHDGGYRVIQSLMPVDGPR